MPTTRGAKPPPTALALAQWWAGAMVAAVLAASAVTATPVAATGGWRTVPLYGGGYSNLVRYNPSDGRYVLMATDVGGIHVSSDGGVTWQTRARAACPNADRVAGIVWHPTLANVAYALVGNGAAGSGCLLATADFGASWTVASPTPAGQGNNTGGLDGGLPKPHPRSTGNLIAIDAGRNLVYVGTFRDGILRAPLSPGGTVSGPLAAIALQPTGGRYHYVRSIALDPADPTRLFVGLHTGDLSLGSGKAVRVTGANGAPTVAELAGGPRNVEELTVLGGNLYGVANDPGGLGSGLFRLAAAGSALPSAPWRRIPLAGAPEAWYSLSATLRTGVTTIWVASAGAWRPSPASAWKFLWKGTSTDAFATDGSWTSLPNLPTDTPNDVAGPAVVATPDTWWKLSDGTYAWPGRDPGYTAGDVTVSPSDPTGNTVIFAGQGGPWRTTDGGSKWYPIPNGDNILVHKRVAADPLTAGRVVLGNVDFKAFVTGDSFRTAERVSSLDSGLSHDGWSAAWDTATNPSTLYLGVGERDTNTGGQLWMSPAPGTDGAWTQVGDLPGGGARPIGLAVLRDPKRGIPIVLAVVQGSGLWRKAGEGAWTQAAGFTTTGTAWPQTVQFVWSAGFRKVYVYDRTSGLWRSDDVGATWTRISPATTGSNLTGYVATVPGNENQVVLSTPAGVTLLTNAGSAGTDGATGPDLGLPSGGPGAIAVSPTGRLYAANTTSGIWATTLIPSGTTGGWAALDDAVWHDMVDAPGELAVDRNGSVYATAGGGALVLDGGG